MRAFRSLRNEAHEAAGLDCDPKAPAAGTYERYREWLPFHHRRRTFIDRVTVALGYHKTRHGESAGHTAPPRPSLR